MQFECKRPVVLMGSKSLVEVEAAEVEAAARRHVRNIGGHISS